MTRRNAIHFGMALAIPPGMLTLLSGCDQSDTQTLQQTKSQEKSAPGTSEPPPRKAEEAMKVRYLEIVTPEVDAMCQQYSAIHGITFGDPEPNLGGARTAELTGGGLMGIRGPMRESETPVVRPYLLVDDIKAAVKAAADAGAEVAMPPMEIPEHGTFAIVIHGGIECGFWQD